MGAGVSADGAKRPATTLMGSTARRILVDGGRRAGVLSALLLLLAQPPFGLFPLAFISLVPLALAIARQPEGPEGRWASTRVGMLFGAVAGARMAHDRLTRGSRR